jgi:hypothetical protein
MPEPAPENGAKDADTNGRDKKDDKVDSHGNVLP